MNINEIRKLKFNIPIQASYVNELSDLRKNLSSSNYRELILSKDSLQTKSTTDSNSKFKLLTDPNYKVNQSKESIYLLKNLSALSIKNIKELRLINNDSLPNITTEANKIKQNKLLNYKQYKLKNLIDSQKTLTKSVFLGHNYGNSKWHSQHENLSKRVFYDKQVKIKKSIFMNKVNHNYREYIELKAKRLNKQNSDFSKSKIYSMIVRNRLDDK